MALTSQPLKSDHTLRPHIVPYNRTFFACNLQTLRSEGDDEVTVAVTLEGFQEAFHDIGAAFMLVGERFRGTAAAVGNKSTGVSCDAEEDDDCFRSLVASLG